MMKKLNHFAIFFFILVMLTMDSCEILKDKEDCNFVQWEEPEEPTIYLKLKLQSGTYAELLEMGYPIGLSSNQEKLIGTIMKVYCGGKESGKFDFEKTYFPKNMEFSTLTGGFTLAQPYMFKFENDGDYLTVISHIKTYLADGKIFETKAEIVQKYFFDNIKLDVSSFNYYIDVEYPADVDWVEVFE